MKHALRLLVLFPFLVAVTAVHAQQNALNFDGTNDYAVLFAGSLPNYTIECWVRFTGTSTAGQNIIVYTSSSGPNSTYSHQIFTDASGHFCHYVFDGNAKTITGTSVAALNTWYHVAITGTTNAFAKLYVNGIQEGGNMAVTSNWTGGDRFHLGGTSALGSFLRGTVDELRIWDRELCSSELSANMNGELLNPAAQSGLHRYYMFNQGTAGGTNTGLITATDASASASGATLYNFALANGTSNWVGGTISGALSTSSNARDMIATSNTTTTVTISGSTVAANCALISNMAPRAGVPLTGSVTTRVMLDGSVQSFGGQAYVPRHYHIEPATNPNTATATLTLYYSQADFTVYNASRGSLPSLPTSTSDVANAANLRISQFHGLPTGGYTPANYPTTWGGSGPARVLITPSSVTYNTTYGRWDVVIPVTGFSGFFASTTSTPLPLRVLDFAARAGQDRHVRITWKAAAAGKAGDAFKLQRSSDGQRFETIQVINAAAAGPYEASDDAPFAGTNYYRLLMPDASGDESFTAMQRVSLGVESSISVVPLPAKDRITITRGIGGGTASLTDLQGREVLHIYLPETSTSVDIHRLPAGMYLLRFSDGAVQKVVKE